MPLYSFTPNTKIESSKVNYNYSGLADGSLMNSPTIEDITLDGFQAKGLYDNGNSGASKTIDWSNGDRQKITITANTTLSFSNVPEGQIVTLLIIEDGTGNYTITLPTMNYPRGLVPALDTTPNAKNTVTIFFDGTEYLAQAGIGYA